MFWGSTLASSGLPPFYLHPHVENRLTKQDFSANLDFSSLRSPRRLVLGVSTKKRLSKHDHLDLPRLATMRVYLHCSAVLMVLRIADSRFSHSQDDICMFHARKNKNSAESITNEAENQTHTEVAPVLQSPQSIRPSSIPENIRSLFFSPSRPNLALSFPHRFQRISLVAPFYARQEATTRPFFPHQQPIFRDEAHSALVQPWILE